MPCTNPKQAWKYGRTKNGKQKLVFKRPEGARLDSLQLVPCGKCIDCKLDYSREWATRIVHEYQTAKIGCFITLTFSPENIPADSSVHIEHVQTFIKRLRKKISLIVDNPLTNRKKRVYQKIRYFACGEYGEKRDRPHYHIIILGYDFPDKTYFKTTGKGETLFRSKTLEQLWPYGYSSIGEVNFQTAAYVARYTLKKTKKKGGYEHVDQGTGEILDVLPEFITMSQGIGKDWWKKYKTDTDKDYLVVDYDKKTKVPRYYDKQREKEAPESLELIKQKREKEAKERQKTDTRVRKIARNIVKKTQAKMLKRGYESGE